MSVCAVRCDVMYVCEWLVGVRGERERERERECVFVYVRVNVCVCLRVYVTV